MARQLTVRERLEKMEKIERILAIEKELLLISQRTHELELELKTLITIKPVRSQRA